MSNEQSIEQDIQSKGLNAPRLTPDHIDSVIQSVHFFTAGDGYAGALASSEEFNSLPEVERFINPPQQLDLLTFCVIVLKNGFTVTGESACASPDNFDAEIGKKIAYQNAREKIWMDADEIVERFTKMQEKLQDEFEAELEAFQKEQEDALDCGIKPKKKKILPS